MENFSGRVAVITGAASGIGRALAEAFAAKGMRIVLADVEANALEAAERKMREAGADVIAVRTDVSKAESVEELARRAYARYGVVHILCNNAGVSPPDRYVPVWETSLEDWKWALDVNLWGVIHGIHSFIPRMLESKEDGHIVNTASVAGLTSGSGVGAYSVSKHGVVRLSEALYAGLRERAANIDVSVLCPGVVATGIYNSERNRPGANATGLTKAQIDYHALAQDLYRTAMNPAQVADQVLAAVRDKQFYVVTTRAFDAAIQERCDAILARRNPEFPDLLEMSRRDCNAE